jgi:hypothetical protein
VRDNGFVTFILIMALLLTPVEYCGGWRSKSAALVA